MSKVDTIEAPPRFRLAKEIDLSKAKRSCKRCSGSGVNEIRNIDDPDNKGKTMSVPVICRCVSRRGGVPEDQLDKMIREDASEIGKEASAKKLANDIFGLSHDAKINAIRQLENVANNKDKRAIDRELAMNALERVLHLTRKEARYGDA